MTLLQAVAIGLLALIIAPGYLFYFDVTPKVVILLAGTGIALAWWGMAGSKGAGAGSQGMGAGGPGPAMGARFARGTPPWGPQPALRWFSWLLLLDVVSLSVSTAFSKSPALSAFGTNWRRFGSVIQAAVLVFAWLIASHTAGRPDRVKMILRAIATAGGISAVYGIAQYFGWDPILPAAAYHIGEGIWTIVRPPGTLGYASYFGTWLLFVAGLSLALADMETSSSLRRMAFAAAALSLAAMLLTGTRAAILGLAAGAAVWLYHSGFRLTRRKAAAVALILAAGAAFYFSPPGWKLRSRARWFAEDPWGGNRPNLWRDSLRMGLARLPLGYGPEVFTAAFPPFESKALAQAYPDFAHESPHNIFLDALISQGLPGLLILCALCASGLLIRGEALKPLACPRNRIRTALVAGIVSQQFTVFTLPTALIFYITIALAVGLTSDPVEPRRDWRFTFAAAPVALALIYLAARFTLADHALALARRSVESGDLRTAVAHYRQYQRWQPPGTTSDLWYSRALLGLAQKTPDFGQRFQAIAQSGAAAVRATQAAEDPFNAWYNMATQYASQNDWRRTEQSLRAAIAANPRWFKPHWTLAQLLRLENRMEEAETEAAQAAELDGDKNPEVAQTLVEIRAQRAGARAFEHK